MASERNRHQRETRYCKISDTWRVALCPETRAHPAEKEDKRQAGSVAKLRAVIRSGGRWLHRLVRQVRVGITKKSNNPDCLQRKWDQ